MKLSVKSTCVSSLACIVFTVVPLTCVHTDSIPVLYTVMKSAECGELLMDERRIGTPAAAAAAEEVADHDDDLPDPLDDLPERGEVCFGW